MASTATPYGLIPVGSLAGSSLNGKVREIAIASGYNANVFKGDVVKLHSDGTIQKDTGTATATPVGIFMGCRFTNPTTKQPTWSNMWTAATVASDAHAFVVDDPSVIFRVQAASAITQDNIGNNAALVQGTGSTAYGLSRVHIGSPATTNTLPVKIIGFYTGPSSVIGDAYTDVLCVWNAGMHQYLTATGV